MVKRALVLFAHGARDPGWAEPFVRIRDLVAARVPAVPVELAFLELMSPPLAVAIERVAAAGATHVSVAPLFMAQGGHLKEDLPRLVAELRQKHGGVRIELLPPVGEVEAVLLAITDWLAASLEKGDPAR